MNALTSIPRAFRAYVMVWQRGAGAVCLMWRGEAPNEQDATNQARWWAEHRHHSVLRGPRVKRVWALKGD